MSPRTTLIKCQEFAIPVLHAPLELPKHRLVRLRSDNRSRILPAAPLPQGLEAAFGGRDNKVQTISSKMPRMDHGHRI